LQNKYKINIKLKNHYKNIIFKSKSTSNIYLNNILL